MIPDKNRHFFMIILIVMCDSPCQTDTSWCALQVWIQSLGDIESWLPSQSGRPCEKEFKYKKSV